MFLTTCDGNFFCKYYFHHFTYAFEQVFFYNLFHCIDYVALCLENPSSSHH